jgi:Domain of unknown function (DUF4386)
MHCQITINFIDSNGETLVQNSSNQSHSAAHHQTIVRWLGALLIIEACLAFAPLAILAPAIGWPASLGNPAREQLLAIAAKADAVRLGYSVYLLYSILIAPLMIALCVRVLRPSMRTYALIVIAFAAISAFARSIGILRWLTVMPDLASQYSKADAVTQTQTEIVFRALNNYGGAIGEVLGVSVFMAIALFALCCGALRSRGMPSWLAWSGIVCALLLAALALPTFGLPAIMPIAVAVTALSVWMLIAGVACIAAPKRWGAPE